MADMTRIANTSNEDLLATAKRRRRRQQRIRVVVIFISVALLLSIAMAYTPDGKTLASASADKTIKLWEAPRYK